MPMVPEDLNFECTAYHNPEYETDMPTEADLCSNFAAAKYMCLKYGNGKGHNVVHCEQYVTEEIKKLSSVSLAERLRTTRYCSELPVPDYSEKYSIHLNRLPVAADTSDFDPQISKFCGFYMGGKDWVEFGDKSEASDQLPPFTNECVADVTAVSCKVMVVPKWITLRFNHRRELCEKALVRELECLAEHNFQYVVVYFDPDDPLGLFKFMLNFMDAKWSQPESVWPLPYVHVIFTGLNDSNSTRVLASMEAIRTHVRSVNHWRNERACAQNIHLADFTIFNYIKFDADDIQYPISRQVERLICTGAEGFVLTPQCFGLTEQGFRLNRGLRELMRHWMARRNFVNIWMDGPFPDQTSSSDPYRLYLRELAILSEIRYEKQVIVYDDFKAHISTLLPLEPLKTDLTYESSYKMFELDVVKYDMYGKAIYTELFKIARNGVVKPKVAILGVGTGGLCSPLLNAITRIKAQLPTLGFSPILFAIEKNQNEKELAMIGYVLRLRKRNNLKWGRKFKLVLKDMRSWKPDFTMDLVISELLGGFGCNEASPECLHGARHLFHERTISIPCAYSSVVQLMDLGWRNIESLHYTTDGLRVMGPLQGEVYQCYHHFAITRPKVAWKFEHHGRYVNQNFEAGPQDGLFKLDEYGHLVLPTDRTVSIEFFSVCDTSFNAITGTFFADLGGDKIVNELGLKSTQFTIGTAPFVETNKMWSWGSTVICLPKKINVKKGERIVLKMWRRSDMSRFWYEWQFLEPIVTERLNMYGKSQAFWLTTVRQGDWQVFECTQACH